MDRLGRFVLPVVWAFVFAGMTIASTFLVVAAYRALEWAFGPFWPIPVIAAVIVGIIAGIVEYVTQ